MELNNNEINNEENNEEIKFTINEAVYAIDSYGVDDEWTEEKMASPGGAASVVASSYSRDKWTESAEQCKIEESLSGSECLGCIKTEDGYDFICDIQNKTNSEIGDDLKKLLTDLSNNNIKTSYDGSLADMAKTLPLNKKEALIEGSDFRNKICWDDDNEEQPYTCDYPDGVVGYSLLFTPDDLSPLEAKYPGVQATVDEWNKENKNILSAPWQNIRQVGCAIRREEYFGNPGLVINCLTRN